MEKHTVSRRSLLQATAALTALGALGSRLPALEESAPLPLKLKPGSTILFQGEFDKACRAADAKFWLWDGIHPTVSGHALMAQAWRRAVGI